VSFIVDSADDGNCSIILMDAVMCGFDSWFCLKKCEVGAVMTCGGYPACVVAQQFVFLSECGPGQCVHLIVAILCDAGL